MNNRASDETVIRANRKRRFGGHGRALAFVWPMERDIISEGRTTMEMQSSTVIRFSGAMLLVLASLATGCAVEVDDAMDMDEVAAEELAQPTYGDEPKPTRCVRCFREQTSRADSPDEATEAFRHPGDIDELVEQPERGWDYDYDFASSDEFEDQPMQWVDDRLSP